MDVSRWVALGIILCLFGMVALASWTPGYTPRHARGREESTDLRTVETESIVDPISKAPRHHEEGQQT